MNIIKTSIKRPVTIIMCMVVVVILGIVSIIQLDMELIPSSEIPYALVAAQYTGSGPEEVENLVTAEIEGAVANVENVKEIMSISSEGLSLVIVQFEYGVDMTECINNIRDRMSMVSLPDTVDSPTIIKMDTNAMPVAYVTVTSDSLSDNEFKNLVNDKIQPRLERQGGVASVDVTGGAELEIIVEITPERLEGLGLNMSQIAQMIAAENVNQPGGSIDYGDKSLTISSRLKLTGIDEIKEIPIVLSSGNVVALEEIATITERNKEIDTISRYNGQPCITLSITKSSDGNMVSTVDGVRKEIEKLSTEYPNLHMQVVNDSAEIITDSVNNVISNIFMGAFLAILILYIFLRNVGLTATVAVSIPLSIVITFVLLYFSGISLNLLSLGGLSIGVGMMVDNSVVVLENIHRYRTAEGYGKVKGTYRATKEVIGAILASTLTTIVIFLPFVFVSGMIKEMFTDLALSIVFALVASFVVAVTVVPMITGNYVNNVGANRAPKKLNFINIMLSGFDKGFEWLKAFYDRVLRWVVRHKKRTLAIVCAIFAASLCLVPVIGIELLPSADEGMLNISVELPKGSKTEVVNDMSLRVEEKLADIPEIVSTTVSISSGSSLLSSSNVSSISCELVDKKQRKKSTDEIAEEIRVLVADIPGAEITVSPSSSISAMTGGGVTVEITGDDLDTLEAISEEVVRQMANIEGTRQITSSIDSQDQQVSIEFNKDKIRQYGMTAAEVATQIRNSINGVVATTLKSDGVETDIRLTYPEDAYANLSELEDLVISTTGGQFIPLASIASIQLDGVPTAIYRTNQSRIVSVTCEVYGRDTGSIGTDVEKVLAQMSFPEGYNVALAGTNEMITDTINTMALIVVLAIVLVYIVMAAQFQSLINPFVILFTILLALTGAIFALFIGGEPISMTSLLGCLILVGIVVNNGIILIDFIDVLRYRDGLSPEEAVLKACPTRLRPILMTALTTILGQVPLIVSNGANSEMLRGMGLVIAGGLLSSTILTLIVVPVLYLIFDGFTTRFKKKLKLKPRQSSYEIEAECN